MFFFVSSKVRSSWMEAKQGDDEKYVSEIIMLLLDVTVERFYERTNSAKMEKLLFENI